MKKQTAGRKQLGDFAPQFAALNDDVLFGEVWAKENELSARDRSLITIACLMTSGDFPQLKAHLKMGKDHGLTKEEVVATVTGHRMQEVADFIKGYNAAKVELTEHMKD